ncbi:hypothetical protein [Ornithinicoccus hortensis]|uniref:VOC domain-containing protein n=1 Tax=Ornithinicoccus hortensis TaxID=82346 RepID=A0A542YLQ6_9MICO|nr:hypothetical protein [Ornithinicoccus hortensis]TQL49020.1 hypothetical protein FB467_0084 [Ornithinicoccus hortensis]
MSTGDARVGSVFFQTTDTSLAVALFSTGLGLEPVSPSEDYTDQEWVEFEGAVPIFVQRVPVLMTEDAAFGIQVGELTATAERLRRVGAFELSEAFEISPGAAALHVSGPGLQRLLVHE